MSRVVERVFLKLGGALVTDKGGREAVREDVLARLAGEIAAWPGWREGRLVVAHGSGSFAHVAARETGFLDRRGDAMAFARVAAAARRLNGVVVDALLAAGVPAVGVPGGLVATCEGDRVASVRHAVLDELLERGIVPVTYGDAAPDRAGGGAIASTEPLLAALAGPLGATRIVLATDVDGVFTGDPSSAAGTGGAGGPKRTSGAGRSTRTGDPGGAASAVRRLDVITPADRDRVAAFLGGARAGAPDVTGGMATKVAAMLELVAERAAAGSTDLEVRIVSGLRPGAVRAALAGEADAGGTAIRAGD